MPPSEYHPPHSDHKAGYEPPALDYLPPKKPKYEPTSDFRPPAHDYLPPPEEIPAIDEEVFDILEPPFTDYLPPPSRGPQYLPPPPRDGSDLLTVAPVNGHSSSKQQDLSNVYIPPKTKNDVPKNFLRPEDIPELEDPDIIDFLDAELEETIEALGLDGIGKLEGDDEEEDNVRAR